MTAKENMVRKPHRAFVRRAPLFSLGAACVAMVLMPVGTQLERSAKGAAARGAILDVGPASGRAERTETGVRADPGGSVVDARPVVTITPEFTTAQLLEEAPEPTAADLARRDQQLEALWQARRAAFQLPSDPANGADLVVPGVPTDPIRGLEALRASAPDDFAFFKNTVMVDAFTNNRTSRVNEPTVAVNCDAAFYAGNWYASVSDDFGTTFSYINPYTRFPVLNGGFCCDQVVYYEESRDGMFWYLQNLQDGLGNNSVRIAVSTSRDNVVNNIWHSYAISAQDFGYANGVWLDFPDLSASSNFLYISTNINGHAVDKAIVMRLDLDDLVAGNQVTFVNFVSPLPNLRLTHGAKSTMYVGTQVANGTLRIYNWPEAAGAPGSVARAVNAWFVAASTAPSPDGSDWIARDFHDILAAWVGDGVIGLMWGSAQGGAFPRPHVRWARFQEVGQALIDQGEIWHAECAWGYPAVHPNDRGDIAGTIAVGGGASCAIPFPGVRAWIADDVNGDTIQPLENHFVADGTAGPSNNRWGDFLTSRRSHPAGNTWAATGFVLNGGQANTDSEARFLWFGRERDAPDMNTICDHKMHWPQLPDPNGWDVRVFEPKILADDWRCSETGGVGEIYFWGSWREDLVGQVTNIHVSIHSDIPDPDGDGQLYSMPGDLLWERDFPPGEGPGFFTYEPGGKGDQGWYDPNTGEYLEHDHTQYFKYKIVDIPEPFKQQEGTIYWLDIQVVVAGQEEFGWKTTRKPFNDDAVWGDWNPVEDPNGIVWSELREPITFESLDLAFYINGQALVDPKIPAVSEWGLIITSLLLVSGGTVLIVRRRATSQPV